MRKPVIFILMLLFVLSYKANAININIKQKYPYSVLTEDYGILNEADLDTDGIKPPSFLPKEGFGYVYWQCFSRDGILIDLKDMGYSSEDIGQKENYSDLKITVSNKPGVYHEYTMRRVLPTTAYEARFKSWIKLMKGEKYVCLAGNFVNRADRIQNGKKQQIYSWIFEKMKTTTGCDSYFEGECRSDK